MIFRNVGTRKIGRRPGARDETTHQAHLTIAATGVARSETLVDRLLIDVSTDNAADASGVPDGMLELARGNHCGEYDAAFGDAPAGMDDGDSITFDGALAGATITLGNGQFTISDDLTIDGSAGGASRITLDAGDLNRSLSSRYYGRFRRSTAMSGSRT